MLVYINRISKKLYLSVNPSIVNFKPKISVQSNYQPHVNSTDVSEEFLRSDIKYQLADQKHLRIRVCFLDDWTSKQCFGLDVG